MSRRQREQKEEAQHPALRRLRKISATLPEVREVVTFGHPTFQTGRKTFAVLEHYKGVLMIAVKTTAARQRELVSNPQYLITPYVGRHGWVSVVVDGQTDWPEVASLVIGSYRLVAAKRLVALVDRTSSDRNNNGPLL
jgi:predicted DNA-binding protein (MmcQ/YjbR family)